MLIRRDDGYEIDSSAGRLDIPLLHRWLSTDAYWAIGRPLATVRTSFEQSIGFGVYAPDGRPVGCARAVTDRATFAWLCDVYIEPPARGLGLGTWLAQTVTEAMFGYGVRRVLLATGDAHGVYAKATFEPLAAPERWMEAIRPGATRPTGP